MVGPAGTKYEIVDCTLRNGYMARRTRYHTPFGPNFRFLEGVSTLEKNCDGAEDCYVGTLSRPELPTPIL